MISKKAKKAQSPKRRIYRAPAGSRLGGLSPGRTGRWWSYSGPAAGVCRFPITPTVMGLNSFGPFRRVTA